MAQKASTMKKTAGKRKISQEEYTTNKVLAVFSICLCGVLLLMILQRLINYTNTWQIGYLVQKILLGVGIVGVIAGIVMIMRERKQNRSEERMRFICGKNVLICSAILCVVMAAVGLVGDLPIKVMYVVLPALAVYYLVYYSYAIEFFWIAVDCGVAAGLVWLVRLALNSQSHQMVAYAALALAVVLCIVQLALVLRAKKKEKSLPPKARKGKQGLSKNAYLMLLITPVVMALAVVVAAIVGLTVNTVCLCVVGAYLFVTVVYYTVKLI